MKMSKGDIAETIQVSAINHYVYCPRRCYLVYSEQIWDENIYTMRGNDLHENVHAESSHVIEEICLERSLPIWSKQFGLVGKADLVEFYEDIPYPVEYKSGKYKKFQNDPLQLFAQAVCLEEMFDVPVEKGAIYWHGSRERKEVVFTENMRGLLDSVVCSVREMLAGHKIPPPVNDNRCRDCSLKESCMPQVLGNGTLRNKMIRGLFEITVSRE